MVAADELLGPEELAAGLAALPGWELQGAELVRTFELGSFPEAVAALVAVAEAAEAAQHHPDMELRYRRLTFRLTTHSAGGLTRKDLDLAGAIEGCVARVRAGEATPPAGGSDSG
jgi:4a-hydroxytetrahydrobiopterin dehydratase